MHLMSFSGLILMYVIKFYMHFTITCMHFYHIHLCLSCIQCACSACVQYGSCTCLYVIACYLHAYHNHAFVYSYTVHVLLHLHACHNYMHFLPYTFVQVRHIVRVLPV